MNSYDETEDLSFPSTTDSPPSIDELTKILDYSLKSGDISFLSGATAGSDLKATVKPVTMLEAACEETLSKEFLEDVQSLRLPQQRVDTNTGQSQNIGG